MRRVVPVLIAVVAALVAGLSWSISSPPGSSPDENYHLASSWCPPPVESSGCALVKTADGETEIMIDARVVNPPLCYAGHPEQSADCIWKIPAGTLVASDRYNKGEYPGGYYHVMHLFVGPDVYSTVYLIRAVNIGLAVLVATGLVLAATRPVRRILAYTVASTFVPMGVFVVASVNPSGWAFVGVTATAFAMHSYWLAESRGRMLANAGLVAVGVAMAANSRADACVYAVLAVLGISLLHYRQVPRHPWRLTVPAAAIAVSVVAYRQASQAAMVLSGTGLGTDGQQGQQVERFLTNLTRLPYLLFGNQGLGSLASLGWLDTELPPAVAAAMIIVCAFLFMAGLSRMSWMKAVVVTGAIAVLVALPMYVLTVSGISVGEYLQARYVGPLLPAVSLLVLTGRSPDEAVRLPLLPAWVAWALVSGANSLALLVNIRRYATGVDGSLIPGRQIEWWMPHLPGPRATWIVGSLAFAVVAWLVVRVTQQPDLPEPVRVGAAPTGDPVVALEGPGTGSQVEGVVTTTPTTGAEPVARGDQSP